VNIIIFNYVSKIVNFIFLILFIVTGKSLGKSLGNFYKYLSNSFIFTSKFFKNIINYCFVLICFISLID